MTDRIDTAALRRARGETTQGEWEVQETGSYFSIYPPARGATLIARTSQWSGPSHKPLREANARFIALAHREWPALLDRIDALEAEVERLRHGIGKHLDMLEHGYAPFIEDRLSENMCCNGQSCGCRGASVGEYLAHLLREDTGTARTALGDHS